LLDYLKRTAPDRYKAVVEKLNLRRECFSRPGDEPGRLLFTRITVSLALLNTDSGRWTAQQPNYIARRPAAEARLTSAHFP
jgi:hypothetical protein